MPADPLREKLKALVELWREEDLNSKACSPASVRVERRYQLSALLAESEPCTVQECKDLGQCACFRTPHPGKTHYQGDDCPGGHASVCGYCGAPCPTCRKCPHGAGMDECPVLDCRNHFDPGAEPAPLRLGHEFQGASSFRADYCLECLQPREAH